MRGRKKWLSVLIRVLNALLALVLLAFTAVSLILSQPRESGGGPALPQPPLTPSPGLSAAAESELTPLVKAFPVPVMSFMSGSGMTFVSAASADAAFGGGLGRVATLYWQTPSGEPMILQSIYPADGYSLMSGSGYHFSRTAGPTLFGEDSVRMENGETVRIHAATESGLYAFIVPRGLSGEVASIARSLQLFTVPGGT